MSDEEQPMQKIKRAFAWVAFAVGVAPPAALGAATWWLLRKTQSIVAIFRVIHARYVVDPVMQSLGYFDGVSEVSLYRGGSADQFLRKWGLSSSAKEQRRLWNLDDEE